MELPTIVSIVFTVVVGWLGCSALVYTNFRSDFRTRCPGLTWTRGDRGICMFFSIGGPLSLLSVWARRILSGNKPASW